MGSAVVTVRAARPADEERLRELTFEAKAHWGYDRAFVRRWADGLAFEGPCERWVAEVEGEPVAWAGLIPPEDGVAVLDDLWVDPAHMRRGIGTRLFRFAESRARELGACRLEWGAERHAIDFYEKLGGHFLRTHMTEWGREGRWYGMEL